MSIGINRSTMNKWKIQSLTTPNWRSPFQHSISEKSRSFMLDGYQVEPKIAALLWGVLLLPYCFDLVSQRDYNFRTWLLQWPQQLGINDFGPDGMDGLLLWLMNWMITGRTPQMIWGFQEQPRTLPPHPRRQIPTPACRSRCRCQTHPGPLKMGRCPWIPTKFLNNWISEGSDMREKDIYIYIIV